MNNKKMTKVLIFLNKVEFNLCMKFAKINMHEEEFYFWTKVALNTLKRRKELYIFLNGLEL
jgi:hypothetical protein